MNVYQQASKQLSEERSKRRIQQCKDLLTQIDKLEGEIDTAQDTIRLNTAKVTELKALAQSKFNIDESDGTNANQ